MNKNEVKKLTLDRRNQLLAEMVNPQKTEAEIAYCNAVSSSLRDLLVLKSADSSDITCDEELVDRINFFFEQCTLNGIIPTVEKASVALGYPVGKLGRLKSGQDPGYSPNTKMIIQQLYTILGAVNGDLAMKSKINPVVYIFTAKNHYDMVDKKEVVVAPTDVFEVESSKEVIEAKYKELPLDDE